LSDGHKDPSTSARPQANAYFSYILAHNVIAGHTSVLMKIKERKARRDCQYRDAIREG
jgi:hypothetical protein